MNHTGEKEGGTLPFLPLQEGTGPHISPLSPHLSYVLSCVPASCVCLLPSFMHVGHVKGQKALRGEQPACLFITFMCIYATNHMCMLFLYFPNKLTCILLLEKVCIEVHCTLLLPSMHACTACCLWTLSFPVCPSLPPLPTLYMLAPASLLPAHHMPYTSFCYNHLPPSLPIHFPSLSLLCCTSIYHWHSSSDFTHRIFTFTFLHILPFLAFLHFACICLFGCTHVCVCYSGQFCHWAGWRLAGLTGMASLEHVEWTEAAGKALRDSCKCSAYSLPVSYHLNNNNNIWGRKENNVIM